MTTTQPKPAPLSHPAPKPVSDARARTLQEQIRSLREQARHAGDRLLEATERNREHLQAEWERAEQACRQAEEEMARLRSQALGASPAHSPAFDRQHPASLVPGEVLEKLVTPVVQPAPLALFPGDPDRGCDRHQAANLALDLLQRASEPLLHNSPILEMGLIHPADTATVKASGIDFGPLVMEPAEAPEPPVLTPPAKTATVPRPAAAPAPAPRPVQSRPAPQARPAPVQRPAPSPGRRPHRSRFAATLLAGALLGGMIILAAIWFAPQLLP